MINNAEEACEAYRWLLDDDDERERFGNVHGVGFSVTTPTSGGPSN